jgi:predicted MFS family arabinose efflux permease
MMCIVQRHFEEYAKVFGLLATSSRVGAVSAAVIVSVTVASLGWRGVLFCTCTVLSCVAILAAFLLPRDQPTHTEPRPK